MDLLCKILYIQCSAQATLASWKVLSTRKLYSPSNLYRGTTMGGIGQTVPNCTICYAFYLLDFLDLNCR